MVLLKKKKEEEEEILERNPVLRNLVRALLQCVVLCPTAICPTAIAKEEQSTRVGPTDNFEQSKEKNYPPTSLVTSALYLLFVGRGSLCALCAPSGRRGESRRAGDGNPALLLLCSNRPQQPARQRRAAIFGCEDRVAIFAGEDRELLADRGRLRNWYY